MVYRMASSSGLRTALRKKGHPCYISRMARRFVYILLAVIALQFSWSAVAAYCMHETGRAAQHFGHHQHVEDGDEFPVANKDTPAVVKKFSVHSHCASCHHATVAIDTFHVPLYLHVAAAAPDTEIVPLSSVYIPPPERPQWNSAA